MITLENVELTKNKIIQLLEQLINDLGAVTRFAIN